jgi:hypothetical protein
MKHQENKFWNALAYTCMVYKKSISMNLNPVGDREREIEEVRICLYCGEESAKAQSRGRNPNHKNFPFASH